MTAICYARADRYEPTTIRCAVCKLSWDVDDPNLPPCPRVTISPAAVPMTKAQIREHVEGKWEFATGLPFVDSEHRK